MESYSSDIMASQLLSQPHMATQFTMDGMAYQLPDANALTDSLKNELLGDLMDPFEDIDFRAERSLSFSGTSSQSLSPQPHNRQIMPHIPELQTTNALYAPHMEQISPTTSVSSPRKDSGDDDHRAERRRAQNRAAQRAYRQRKDQSLKQREKEVESLRDELDKAQRLNRTLCKVVALLRERLKEPAAGEEEES